MRRYLVFDWGGTYFKYAVMDEKTKVLEKSKVPSPPGTSDQEHLYALIDPIVETYREEIEGIAVSMPGMLD
ncbi:MAG: ROK family protein, partial [Solobacterium sp.]|nr:ROK family protein [Solobacterium sp.]